MNKLSQSPSSALALAFLLAICAIAIAITATAAPAPAPGAAIVMVDNTTAYPTNSIATPSELQLLQQQLTPLAAEATTAINASISARSLAEDAYNSIRFIDSSNIVVSTAYIPSVGTPASAGTNQTIRIHSMRTDGSPVTNIHIIATFDKLQTLQPTIDWRASLTTSTPGDWIALTNVVCSWPATVPAPGIETPFVYSFDIPAPNPGNAFIRVISLDSGGAGSGYYFLIYNYISINGRRGWSGQTRANDNTLLDFVGGLCVEPF